MRTRIVSPLALLLLLFATAVPASAQYSIAEAGRRAGEAYRRAMAEARAAYQGDRGPDQADRFSRKYRIGRDGRVSIQNVAGDITVTTGAGDEVSIDAVKHTRRDRSELGRVDIVVEEHTGRIDVRTEHRAVFRDDHVWVDYTVVVPEGASVELRSVSGGIRVTGVKGIVRAQSVSGNVTASNTPRVEQAKTVSGNVQLAGVSMDGDVWASSISGSVRADGLKARGVDISTVSGEIALRETAIERLNARSISGSIEYSGSLARNGRYDVNSHSGAVRFMLTGGTGFELSATSFSGSVRSEYPLTVGGTNSDIVRRGRRGPGNAVQATFGDGSASLRLRTFSGDVVLARR